MQPMSTRYVAKSIQDDRLAVAARDRRLLSVASYDPNATHAGIRMAMSSRFAALVARVVPATPH